MRRGGYVLLLGTVLAGAAALVWLGPPGCGGTKKGKITLRLNWYPEVEHGGFYAALVDGLYEEEGLDVEIIRGSDKASPTREVESGAVTFGIENADGLLLARQNGMSVVAVLASMQQCPVCIMVHEKSGIRNFDQLHGVTLAVQLNAPYYRYLSKRLAASDVQIVPFSGGVSEFLRNPKYAQQGYVFSEPLLVRKREQEAPDNADPYCLMVSDLGYNPYASILFTRASIIQDDPEMVAKMVRASVRGWQHYLANPEKANAKIHEQNPGFDLPALAEGVDILRPLVLDKVAAKHGIGFMTQERWRTLLEQLQQAGIIDKGSVSPSAVFDTQFLPRQ